ncbi:hypothetical protein T459_21249 [Capsicum annuum]|uniref:Uncharacterized protein n=1 Tax=Capsicum annuum TaxID=4072 RepID=A0A2G2YW46_CAPAN|nr:hypothetical protein T459_21249 [Capsicum annuum]
MSSGDGRKVSCEDIQMVQNRIEQCLRQYMSRKEVVNTLLIQDNIEPRFAELDILESYSRTPFLATDTGSLLDSNGGIERLTNASENLRYTNFSGD